MRESRYDLRYMGGDIIHYQDNVNMEPIVIDNEAVISMMKCSKDTVGNRHLARRYHCVQIYIDKLLYNI